MLDRLPRQKLTEHEINNFLSRCSIITSVIDWNASKFSVSMYILGAYIGI